MALVGGHGRMSYWGAGSQQRGHSPCRADLEAWITLEPGVLLSRALVNFWEAAAAIDCGGETSCTGQQAYHLPGSHLQSQKMSFPLGVVLTPACVAGCTTGLGN
jgi:hypothetical protein